ncbi:MAG: hypothetical protein ACTIH1_09350 [Corynebacterium casei]|nr:hypothetical protein [Corynebacterium casei]MDN5707282.1 hypothetical protein [Corynebacterium casei]MDN5740859.1 hypothetical protein [Corynebacterium casei]MDN5902448.1 hypothetical protein [Corynebacterium casei]MDN6130658.1 hypothetical protein [Corynebacterium casei]MDN6154531.1 hypothetical protein [Corynebacterium casei]
MDFSQGAIAALMPFLALQGGYSYAGAAGIMLTYSLASSIIQPVLGIMGEKRHMFWLIPVSVTVSGIGIASIGSVSTYWSVAALASALRPSNQRVLAAPVR